MRCINSDKRGKSMGRGGECVLKYSNISLLTFFGEFQLSGASLVFISIIFWLIILYPMVI